MDDRSGKRPGRPRAAHVLLLCEDDRFAYRVLRAAVATGARVSILARGRGARLAFSRYGGRLERTEAAFDEPSPDLVALIDRLAAEWRIDLVAPTNAATTRLLCRVRDRLSAAVVPLPDCGAFDALNDKWRFAQLAARLGLPHPETRLFDDGARLFAALGGDLGARAGVVKPLSDSGGRGIHRIGPGASLAPSRLGYAPILWQAFVPGRTLSASAFCIDGEILTFLVHGRDRGVYTFEDDAVVRRGAAAIVRDTRYSGLVNFDLIVTPGAGHVWLECNPRAFFTIADQAAAGANFMAPAVCLDAGERAAAVAAFNLAAAALKGRRVRKLRGSAWALARGRPLTELDRRMATHAMTDPLMFAWDRLGELGRRLGRLAGR